MVEQMRMDDMMPCIPSLWERAKALRDGVLALRIASDRMASADTIHHLRNCVQTAHGALSLAEAHLKAGKTDDLELLLNLAESRMREGRALIVRTQQLRFHAERPVLRPAA